MKIKYKVSRNFINQAKRNLKTLPTFHRGNSIRITFYSGSRLSTDKGAYGEIPNVAYLL